MGATDELIDFRWKGFPAVPSGTRISTFVASRPALFDAGFNWPMMALRDSAVENNIGVLARWSADHGISLAPHGKTTMAPDLFERQLAAGAWGITAATPWHVRVYRTFGVPRILLANELVDAEFVNWLATELATDPSFEFLCYVDSVAGVRLLADAMAAAPPSRPLCVLVEVGLLGGRTGCRSDADVTAVAREVAKHDRLALVGVSGYEGPLGHGRDDDTLDRVAHYVRRLADTLVRLDGDGLLDARAEEFIVSCGGSGQVDVVTAALAAPFACSRPVRPILRSGAYVTFDHGLYARTSSLAEELRPAIELWCQVLSRPEPSLALLGAGRRDVSFDSGLPIPLWRRAAATGNITALRGTITALNDQHGYLEIEKTAGLEKSADLEIGDLVCLGISHSCTTHDKWQLIPLLDDDRRVLDCIRCYF